MNKDYCIQDNYPEQYCYCYGCGSKNQQGLQIKSYWDGQRATARFTPGEHHIALPGYVYGGLIASLVDCHGIATASAAVAEKEKDGEENQLNLKRYVTASLHVDYLRPTPMGEELEIISTAQTSNKRKVMVEVNIFAGGKLRARGQVVAAPMPQAMA
ncbi:MAG: PaaI family thioesterase [Desulfonatronovibrio sp.]